jgi:hypothetical protein
MLLATVALAISSTVATLFLAYQAVLARTTYVEATESRFLEKKMEICFDNFDSAVRLDAALRQADPSILSSDDWPPKVRVRNAADVERLKALVIPRLDELEAGLTKAEVLGGVDVHRQYLAQKLRGLSKSLLDLRAGYVLENVSTEGRAILDDLSEFIGAQYPVFTGCRMVALGEVR